MQIVQHGAIQHGHGWRRTCGQAALAMIAGTTLEQAAMAIGHRRSTTYRDLIKGFQALSIEHGPRQTIRRNGSMDRRKTYLVRVSFRSGGSHWIVWHEGIVLDSVCGYCGNNEYLVRQGARFSSYMWVVPNDPDKLFH